MAKILDGISHNPGQVGPLGGEHLKRKIELLDGGEVE